METEEVAPETAGAETAAVETEAGAAPEQDFGPLFERFDEMGQGLTEQFTQTLEDRLGSIEQRLPAPQEEPGPAQAGLDEETFYNPERFGQWLEQRDQQVQDRLMAQVQETLQPVLERDTERDFQALEQEYPGIVEFGKEVMGEVAQIAHRHGNPGMAHDVALARLAYEARVGREHIGKETPAGAQQETTALEMGGANPPNPETSQFERLSQQQEKDPARDFFQLT